jgi:hypothetical protein
MQRIWKLMLSVDAYGMTKIANGPMRNLMVYVSHRMKLPTLEFTP